MIVNCKLFIINYRSLINFIIYIYYDNMDLDIFYFIILFLFLDNRKSIKHNCNK